MLISVPFLAPNVRDFLHRAQEQPEPVLPAARNHLRLRNRIRLEKKSRGCQRVHIAFLIELRPHVAFAKHLFMCETGPAC
jgi:hypothetical protein